MNSDVASRRDVDFGRMLRGEQADDRGRWQRPTDGRSRDLVPSRRPRVIGVF
jgi:hypothetical protein